MKIEGNVSYQELEGGFWGIISDDGQKYMPVEGLPQGMQIDGLGIKAELEIVKMMGATMWGETVRIDSIEAAD